MSEIKTSKVKAVQGAGTFESQYGEDLGNGKKGFYKFEYTMEDGTTLTANHKTQTPFGIGEEVEYKITKSDNYGNKGKVYKPSEGNSSPSNASSPNNGSSFKADPLKQASIEKQKCLEVAFNFLESSGYSGSTNDAKVEELAGQANRLYQLVFGE
jgi:hypothetical protein